MTKLWVAKDEKTNYCRLFLDKPYKVYDDFLKKYFGEPIKPKSKKTSILSSFVQ